MAAKSVWAAWAVAVLLLVVVTGQVMAQSPQGPLLGASGRGPVTQLPMPRFVSMKATEGNVRRGPSLSHRIDWVYRRKDLPLMIVAEHGHWRRVQDRDGQGGWVHYSLLSGVRTVLVEADEAPMLLKPADGTPENARAQRGVVARIDRCLPEWCRIRAGGHRGWVRKAHLWGVGPNEVID
ncbi:SH3-like domain-containing protein [Palleronia salina]|uniref:SH3-like domain-containing protein n=2 Tax=Palleronia salina TaxID=313368 RepID=A0A1M6IMJ6_9RHOB|nr:SH3-like domain-containing protein [Palleronia salina]